MFSVHTFVEEERTVDPIHSYLPTKTSCCSVIYLQKLEIALVWHVLSKQNHGIDIKIQIIVDSKVCGKIS